MQKTSIYCAAFLFLLIAFALAAFESGACAQGNAVPGVMRVTPPSEDEGEDHSQGDLESLKEELQKLKEFLESVPESDAAKKFKRALERLGSEIEILEKSFRNTIEKEILPWLKKEMERLKKKLYRYFEEPDDNQPKKVNLPRPEKVSGEVGISCPCV